MANRQRGEVSFEVGGASYTFVFSVNAFCEVEEKTGVNMLGIENMMPGGSNASFRNMRILFWAGLRQHHSGVDLSSVGGIMDALGLGGAVKVMTAALMAAFPDASGPLAEAPGPSD